MINSLRRSLLPLSHTTQAQPSINPIPASPVRSNDSNSSLSSVSFDSVRFDPVNTVNPNPGLGFEHDFIEAAVQRGLGRTSLNALLAVFHKHNIGNFPKDARACVGSLRRVDTISMCDGKYHHFGLLHAVTSALKNAELFSNEISVQICTDGVPVNKSSNNEFWPIMCKVLTPSYDFVSSVFLIGLYIGQSCVMC